MGVLAVAEARCARSKAQIRKKKEEEDD